MGKYVCTCLLGADVPRCKAGIGDIEVILLFGCVKVKTSSMGLSFCNYEGNRVST